MTDWPEGYGRIVLDQTDSTMAEAARRAGELAGPTWIMALRQTAARGPHRARTARSWATARAASVTDVSSARG